jgi:hypothetical protein
MSINSPTLLEQLLVNYGYLPKVSGDTVFVPLGGMETPYTAAFTFNKQGQIQITCQLARLGDFAENKLAEVSLAALDANTQISPYAFAIIGASEGEVEIHSCPVVLIDTLPVSDLCEEEVLFSLDKLLEALTFSRDILKLGLAESSMAATK